MKIDSFIANLFTKTEAYASLFSKAFNEGIKDVFKEMGALSKKEVNPKG
jgi:hypothetical protein